MNPPNSKPTSHFSAEQFVESCGAIPFDFSSSKPSAQVCLVHYKPTDQWVLAKGRRNCGESRQAAALREIEEETGYRCHIFPVTMTTRAPAATEEASVPDHPRSYPDVTEPFMASIREVDGKANIKIIWWYIAEVQDRDSRGCGEADFTAQFFDVEDALDKLAFPGDREVLQRALQIVGNASATT